MRVVIANEHTGHQDDIRPVVLGAGLECRSGDCVSYADLPVRLTQAVADLVLVGLDSRGAALSAIEYAAAHTKAPILAVGPTTDAQAIRQAVRAGAREYLDEANLRDEMVATLMKLHQAGAVEYRRGKGIAVLAATPGSGVTTVATSLAFALAQQHPQRVALTEVGTVVPELAVDLDLTPPHSLANLAGDWQRLDATMMRQALFAHPQGVSVLAYEPETLLPQRLPPAAMRHTLVLLRSMFDYTVLDLGHAADATAVEAVKLSDPVVVVVRLDVPSLRLTRELIRHLTEQGMSTETLCVVANRYGQRQQLPWKKAEKALGMTIATWIPDNPAAVNYALNHGQPLVQAYRRAAITRSFAKLATKVNSYAA